MSDSHPRMLNPASKGPWKFETHLIVLTISQDGTWTLNPPRTESYSSGASQTVSTGACLVLPCRLPSLTWQ